MHEWINCLSVYGMPVTLLSADDKIFGILCIIQATSESTWFF